MELKAYDNKSFSPEYATYTTIDLSENKSDNNNNNNNNHNKCNNTIAVKLTNVSLIAGKCNIFTELNLCVPSGKIFSILGAKKCGKTTILHCITGLMKPAKGEVIVFGRKPPVDSATIGYLPQGMPLYDNLTVKETLDYFGRLYALSSDTVANKLDALIKSAAIDSANVTIAALSYQNQLVVSLAASIIHSPRLLILDEPAKYGDPLSRKSMWAQMRALCESERTTIVITVNHIEEARNADIVGLVSNGRVIAKECSQHTLQDVSVPQLEDAFLSLFDEKSDESNTVLNSEQNDNKLNNVVEQKTSSNGVSLSPSYTTAEQYVPSSHVLSTSTSWQRISALCRKNTLISLRSWRILLIKLLIPALAVIFFCACVGKNPRNIPVGVYNPDKPSFASNLIINNIDTGIIAVKRFATLDLAINAIKENSVWAVIAFPSNYTVSLFSQSSQSCESTEEYDDIEDEHSEAEEAEELVKDLQKEKKKLHIKMMIKTNNATNIDDKTNLKNETTNINNSAKLSMRDTKETERETEENSNNSNNNSNSSDNEREKEEEHKHEEEEEDEEEEEEENNENEHNDDTEHDSGEDSSPDENDTREVNELEEEHRLSRAKPFTIIDLYLDNTNVLIGGVIKRQLLFAMKRAKNKSGELSSGRSGFPLRIMSPPVFGFEDAEMSEFITPGIVIAIIFLSSLVSTSFTLIAERKQRCLERAVVCGVKLYELLAAHVITQVVTLIIQITALLICVFHIFQFPLVGSVFYAFLLIFMQGLCGVAIGIAICARSTEQHVTLMVAMLVFSVALVVGNIFWPVECMPPFAQSISPLLPQTIAATALRSVLLRAWNLMNAAVVLGFVVPVIWIVSLFLLSLFLFRVQY